MSEAALDLQDALASYPPEDRERASLECADLLMVLQKAGTPINEALEFTTSMARCTMNSVVFREMTAYAESLIGKQVPVFKTPYHVFKLARRDHKKNNRTVNEEAVHRLALLRAERAPGVSYESAVEMIQADNSAARAQMAKEDEDRRSKQKFGNARGVFEKPTCTAAPSVGKKTETEKPVISKYKDNILVKEDKRQAQAEYKRIMATPLLKSPFLERDKFMQMHQ
eukprot:Clim_evm28s139 gene=Clim_evmTU28s139